MKKLKKLISLSLSLTLLLTSTLNVQGAVVRGNLVDRNSGMTNIKFKTGTGDLVLNPKLATFEQSDGSVQVAFSYTDPRPLGESTAIKRTSQLMKSEQQVKAILAFPELFTPEEVASNFNINVTQQQIHDAVQVALWQDSALANNSFVLDVSSVTDINVRSLAQSITTWAGNQVFNSDTTDVLDKLLNPSKSKLNTTNVKKEVKDNIIVYGPYSIDNNTSLNYKLTSNVVIKDSTGKTIKEVRTGQQFYVHLDTKSSTMTKVSFSTTIKKFNLYDQSKRIWLQKEEAEEITEFNITSNQSATGTIAVYVSDKFTEKPIDNQEVNIVDASNEVVASTTTDFTGLAEFNLPVGTYYVSPIDKVNYLPTPKTEVKIEFIGSIARVDLPLKSETGRLKLSVMDNESLGYIGTVEYNIYKDNVLHTSNKTAVEEDFIVSLPSGEYYVVISNTNANYAVSQPYYFTIAEGEDTEVLVPLISVENKTQFKVTETSETEQFLFTLYLNGVELLSKESSIEFGAYLEDNVSYTVKATNLKTNASTESMTFKPKEEDYYLELSAVLGDAFTTLTFKDTIVNEPITGIQVGLYDANANLIAIEQTDETGTLTFNNLTDYNVYYLAVVSADNSVSGTFVNGNRFLANDRTIEVKLAPSSETDEPVRTPVIGYTHSGYVYPTKPEPVVIEPVVEEKSWWEFWK